MITPLLPPTLITKKLIQTYHRLVILIINSSQKTEISLPHVQPAIILTSDDGSPPVPHILEGENIDDHNDVLRYEDSDTDQEANIDNL